MLSSIATTLRLNRESFKPLLHRLEDLVGEQCSRAYFTTGSCLKKSLPLSSTMMKAGKSTTSIR